MQPTVAVGCYDMPTCRYMLAEPELNRTVLRMQLCVHHYTHAHHLQTPSLTPYPLIAVEMPCTVGSAGAY